MNGTVGFEPNVGSDGVEGKGGAGGLRSLKGPTQCR